MVASVPRTIELAKATCCEHGTPSQECRWRCRDANFGRQRALSLLDEPSAEERAPKKTDRCASLKSSKDKSASARAPFSSRSGVNKVHEVELFTEDHGRRAPASRGAVGDQ